MYTTETFHSSPAIANYAKMSVSLQNLWTKMSRAVTWCQKISHSLAEKHTCVSYLRTCMFSENECCYFTGVTTEEFPDVCDDVEYYEWTKADGKK